MAKEVHLRDFLNESLTVAMTPEAIKDLMKRTDSNKRPKYQFLNVKGNVVKKGDDVDFYSPDNGDKLYGIVKSVNKRSGVVKILSDGDMYTIQGYPQGVIS